MLPNRGEAVAVFYSDDEIQRLLAEPKPLPPDYRARIRPREKRGHSEQELVIQGQHGSEFRLLYRQSLFNPFDFSVILGVCPPQSNQTFRLRRYNGRSHPHTNTLEQVTFYDFHIHTATSRYQEIGAREDWYAEPTSRFADVHTALNCMMEDCSFILPPRDQGALFEV